MNETLVEQRRLDADEAKGAQKPVKKIPLVEMFGPTIQGEGSVIGQQTYFLRFGLCDYRCTMCDSLHAVDPSQVKRNASWLTQEQIFEAFMAFWENRMPSTKNVTFSGGNPAIHDLGQLASLLRHAGFRVHVETQGTLAPKWLRLVDTLTISPKGPGMGEVTDINVLDAFVQNLYAAPVKYDMKIVIFDRRDVDFAKEMFLRYTQTGALTPNQCYLSLGNMEPPHEGDAPMTIEDISAWHNELLESYRQLFDEIKSDDILSNVKFLPQWHAFVWGNGQGH